ncbi:hypothetical protein [Microbacterium hibisci]|uniref:hypothetical protein n=1 Tax=Microbacterium hibisci TaxID=2036000 RepID=UPI001943F261|nr:hypothetical protein [Microbacterium hibisci]
MPAYAVPSTTDSAQQPQPQPQPQPVDAPPAHQYATPSYAAPASLTGPATVATPAGPSAAATGDQNPAAPGHAVPAAVPPYAHGGGFAPPPYPGAAGPPAPYAPRGVDRRPTRLAVSALVMSGVGIVVTVGSAIAGAIGGVGLALVLLFVAFILSLVALGNRNQGAKGAAVAALLLSILGGIMAFVAVISLVFGSLGSSYSDSEWEDEYDYSVPGLAAPGTDGEPDAGEVFEPPLPLTVVETAFGVEADATSWYAVIIDNPNADYAFESFLTVQAFAADGTLLQSADAFATLLSGRTAVVGYFYDVVDAEIASIDVIVPEPETATLSPGEETGSFTVADVAGVTSPGGATTVTGTVTGDFADDQEFVVVSVIARAADGTIVAATSTYADEVPGDGTPAGFEAWLDPLPADTTFEAFAHR